MTTQEDWHLKRACEETDELFNQADEIINQPHYQVPVGADELQPPSTDSLQPTDVNESKGMN